MRRLLVGVDRPNKVVQRLDYFAPFDEKCQCGTLITASSKVQMVQIWVNPIGKLGNKSAPNFCNIECRHKEIS